MNKYYHLAQRFLKHGPIIIWVIYFENLVLGIGIAFGYGLINAIVFLVNFLGMGTLIIGLFGYRLFPALMEFSEKNKKINIKKWLVALMLLIVTGVALHMFHSKFINLSTEHYMPAITRIVVWLSFIVLGMMLVASIQLTQHYYNSKISEIRLEADKVKAELSILKNQISPHFLFNTLNNIYGLAYMGDKKSATMISKLSQIMRYLIYDCNQEKVLLAREKELIGHYLNLQGLKYEAGKNIDFYEEGIDDQASVPPMILINFVENCFKHSDIETTRMRGSRSAWNSTVRNLTSEQKILRKNGLEKFCSNKEGSA